MRWYPFGTMWAGIIIGGVVLVVLIGLWLTREAEPVNEMQGTESADETADARRPRPWRGIGGGGFGR